MKPRRSSEASDCLSHQSIFAQDVETENRSTIMDDPFIRSYIGELLRSLRTQYLIDLIKPYTRLELAFLATVPYINLIPYTTTNVSNSALATKCRRCGSGRSPYWIDPGGQSRRQNRPGCHAS